MKNKKNAFTLIELLAILSILAIILLIAIPSVLNIIEDSRRSAFISSSLLITKAAEEKIISSFGTTKIVDIDTLKNQINFSDKYSGEIVVVKNEESYKYYLTITDGKYSLCGVIREEVNVKNIKLEECDKYIPYLTHTVNTNEWTKGNIDINLLVSDANNTGFEYITLPNGENIYEKNYIYTVNNNGDYIFKIKNYNNYEKEYVISISNIDNKAPDIVNVAYNYANNKAIITLDAIDTQSGIKKIILPNNESVNNSTASYTIVENGEYVFTIIDNVGNEKKETINISQLDNTPPILILSPNIKDWTHENVIINAISHDTDLDYIELPDGSKGTSYTASENGDYTFKAYDKVGNMTTKVITIDYIDKIIPVVNFTQSTSNWTNSNVVINISASDVGSGIAYILTPTLQKVYSTTTSFTVTTNGTYTFNVVDKALNTKTINVIVSNIDKTIPTGSIAYSTTGWTNGNVTVTATCSDTGGSNIKESTITKTMSANGTGTITCSDNALNTKALNYSVTNIDKQNPNSFSLNPNSGTFYDSVNVTIPLPTDSISGLKNYTYRISSDNGATYGGWTTATSSKTITLSGKGIYKIMVRAFDNAGNYLDVTSGSYTINFGVNAPVLATGMTPIKWDAAGNVIKTTTNDPDWYDYSETNKKWANAMTADGSMWTWIPRYAYQFISGSSTIDVKFLNGTSNTTYSGISAKAVSQGNNYTASLNSSTMLVTHPAFDFGGTQLTGIWVSKFEMTYINNTAQSLPQVGPNIITYDKITTVPRAMETNSVYGWGTSGSGIDTHLMKDVEWGAAVYLATSKYGINKAIEKNATNPVITGCTGSTTCYAYNNIANGGKSSTTGNVYGVFDMHGGNNERTAGHIDAKSGSGGWTLGNFDSLASKYKDVYKLVAYDSENEDPTIAKKNYDANMGYYGTAIHEVNENLAVRNLYNYGSLSISFFEYESTVSTRGDDRPTSPSSSGAFNLDPGKNSATNYSTTYRTVLCVQPGL